ncbi:MAG TPA: hypothetical protein VMZ51_05145 [Acidimicrobiales bacterium]|nr:hypothetical protein [Acidimicrobiales bacterium]
MRPEDVFIGPILRRAAPDLVVVCIATKVAMTLRFSVKEAESPNWLGHDEQPFAVKAADHLWFYFGRVRPAAGLPVGKLLAYGIAVPGAQGWDEAPFERLVAADGLAYQALTLPTFVLQRPGSELNAVYGSCRKVHDEHGGKLDAMAAGDALIARAPRDLSVRPAILCLGGDQIYADEVDPLVFAEMLKVADKLETPSEVLPGPGRTIGRGGRKAMLQRYAKFTSDDLDTHLVRFTEYLALYGLMWNKRNWTILPAKLDHFLKSLPAVRRLMANVATYMIFDDHDVTDDWNLSVRWREEVSGTDLGRRIVANALMAYWLCQDYGNDPDRYAKGVDDSLERLVSRRRHEYTKAEQAFWALDRWEFATPTDPFVYFVDTRTQRGYEDEPARRDRTAPAFLRTIDAWTATVKRLVPLLSSQNPNHPLVLVTAAPVFGFSFVEALQSFISRIVGDYKFDLESWGANEDHLGLFLRLMSGRNVVLLSGDVHYGFTSTVRYTVFDSAALRNGPRTTSATGGLSALPVAAATGATYRPVSEARFLQLNSSALKNYASKVTWLASKLSFMSPATITDEDGVEHYGRYENGVFIMVEPSEDGTGFEQNIRLPSEVRPTTMFRQRINDAYNTDYIEEHNLGVVSFRGTSVRHSFHTPKGKKSERTWDFANARYWE